MFVIPILLFTLVCFLVKRCRLHNYDKGPLRPGCVKSWVDASCLWGSWLSMKIIGLTVQQRFLNGFDYSEWLGPGYEGIYRKDLNTSTIIANHLSHLWDPFIIDQYSPFAAVLEANLRNDCILGTVADALNSLYIDRGGSKEYLQKRVEAIGERQEAIEKSGGQLNRLLIFPAGACDNGSVLSPLRKGPFVSERRVTPVVARLDLTATVSISADVVDIVPSLIVHLCWLGCQTVEQLILPDFEPTEYLFDTHADKGPERWKIIAWAVRDAMSKASGLPASDLPCRLKVPYDNYLNQRTDEDPVPQMLEYLESIGQAPPTAGDGLFFSPGKGASSNQVMAAELADH